MAKHTPFRKAYRMGRWPAATAGMLALWACSDRRIGIPDAPPEQQTRHLFDLDLSRKLDILFMIDNSSSMAPMQEKVSKNIPAFMNVLKSIPGGLPDVHIGVISSSLGAGAFSDVPNCPVGGDRGVMQKSPRGGGGACKAVPRDNYIISADKGTKNNFDGDIADVFSCIAELGDGGCGFEHQLASIKRALGGDPNGAPPENAGFLRKDATLAVVMITNEDDCSAPPDSDLFDTRSSSLSDPLGRLDSFRCNEFGHLCGGQAPPRTPATNLQDCHPAEGAGKLVPVADYVAFLKGLKSNPSRVFVAALAAAPTPYTITVDGGGFPKMSPSCTAGDAFGDPAVRLKAFVDAFGKNGTFQSICSADYGTALEAIATAIRPPPETKCVDAALVDADPTADGLQAQCDVVEHVPRESGPTTDTPLPNCALGSPPCWRMVPNGRECTVSGFEIKIDRSGQPPEGAYASVACATCTDAHDPRCRG